MTAPGSPETPPERFDAAGEGQTPADTASELLTTIWPLLGRHIAFHRRLVDLTGNVKAALLLSQAVYWTRHGRDIAQRDGWFHKTAEQWELELGLSPREQTSARELLRAGVLLEEQRLGLPARMHFRLNLEVLGRRLAERVDGRLLTAPSTDWHDRMLIAELLGPAVAFHRALAAVAGGIHGGLVLSRALHLTRLQARRQRDVWIADSAGHWFEELGLSRREQEAARRDLLQIGVWEERMAGMPSSLFARVRLEVLVALLGGRSDSLLAVPAGSAAVRGNATASVSPNVETRVRRSHSLVSTKPPGLIRRNRHECSDETAIPHKEQSTGDSLQPQNAVSPPAGEPPLSAAVGGGEALIFPDRLLPQERDAAQRLLSQVADQPQALLDELAGRLQTERVRSPVAYLRGLIQRAVAGQFVPELAPRIAAERDRLHREAEARRAQDAEERRLAAERATPEYQALERERQRERRQRISELLSDMRRRIGTPPGR
jgi:hypothetical protein